MSSINHLCESFRELLLRVVLITVFGESFRGSFLWVILISPEFSPRFTASGAEIRAKRGLLQRNNTISKNAVFWSILRQFCALSADFLIYYL